MDRIKEKDFENAVLNCKDMPVIVDFSADWCMPCKNLAKIFEELSVIYATRAKFVNCDAEECQTLTNEYGVMNLPSMFIFKNGEVVDKFVGAMSKAKIVDKIEKFL